MLLNALLDIMSDWRLAFAQDRTFRRAVRQAIGSLCAMGRRTISRAICCLGRDQQDWSAEYLLHSRSEWHPADLFDPILRRAHSLCGDWFVPVSFDSGNIHKTGRKIPGTSWWKDPLSPAFRVNFMWGLRYLQASLLIPHYRDSAQPARGVPVSFTDVPAVKRPGKRASAEHWQDYRKAIKEQNLSTAFQQDLKALRRSLDRAGADNKVMIAALDGGFCNRTCMTTDIERTILLARTRRDAKLCSPAPEESRKVYDPRKFTPEAVRADESIPWHVARIFHGGEWRDVRYKEVGPVLWQGGTQRKPLRLFVLAPTPYRARPNGKLLYREPAYLLCTDCETSPSFRGVVPANVLLQIYFDRWQIEVNHREQKDTLGVGEAQVWSKKSVPRQPALVVAAYSALLLAGILTFGSARSEVYTPLPKWRRNAIRPSLLDLITVLRREIAENPDRAAEFDLSIDQINLVLKAAA